MLTIKQVEKYLEIVYPQAQPGANCLIVDSPSAGAVISVWQLDGVKCPTNTKIESALTTPESELYSRIKSQGAAEIERIILDWQLASVPLEKRSIYERKEWLALGWDTASDEDKALAVKEMEGYSELMAEQGLDHITLYLFDSVPVEVRTLDDLLGTYRQNGRLYRLVLAEAEKWRNKYPMACTLLPVEIDPDAGHGLDLLEQRIAALKAEVKTKIAGVPAMIAGVVG